MDSFITFFRKELIEGHRTKKLYILVGLFMIFGMASPILARYMQEIISLAMGSGAPVLVAKPMWTDSWSQFYSNLAQIGAISMLLLFMGSVSGEKVSKTAALTMTKNLSPTQFILAKYLAAVLTVTAAFLLALAICWCYTDYLFGFAGRFQNILFSAGSYLIFAIVLLALTFFASVMAKSTVSSAILAFGGYLLLLASSYLPVIGAYMPGHLLSVSVSSISDITAADGLLFQILVGAAIVLICIWAAVRRFKSQEL